MTVLTSSSHRAGQGVSLDHFGSLIHHMVLEITLGSQFRLRSHFSENSPYMSIQGKMYSQHVEVIVRREVLPTRPGVHFPTAPLVSFLLWSTGVSLSPRPSPGVDFILAPHTTRYVLRGDSK